MCLSTETVINFQEKELRESQESRRSQGISEMLVAKDQEKKLKGELNETRDQLRMAEDRIKQLVDQVCTWVIVW